MITNFLRGEDVTTSGYLPPSLVTLCHQNLPILATSLPPPSGDVIFERPLRDEMLNMSEHVVTCLLLLLRSEDIPPDHCVIGGRRVESKYERVQTMLDLAV